jgi:hypothetical protein
MEVKSMGIKYTHFYDELQGLLDSLMHDSDQSQRLFNLQQLYKDGTTLMIRARDEAAYDLRVNYSSEDAEMLSGISRKYIDYWARRYMKRNSLPALKKKKRVDLSNAIDLSVR